MTLPLIVLPEAEEEISATIFWYESQRDGLGLEFLGTLERVFQRIVEAPLAFPVWLNDKRYRRARFERFPYLVLFDFRVDSIEIVAVAHSKRKPGYWRLR